MNLRFLNGGLRAAVHKGRYHDQVLERIALRRLGECFRKCRVEAGNAECRSPIGSRRAMVVDHEFLVVDGSHLGNIG